MSCRQMRRSSNRSIVQNISSLRLIDQTFRSFRSAKQNALLINETISSIRNVNVYSIHRATCHLHNQRLSRTDDKLREK